MRKMLFFVLFVVLFTGTLSAAIYLVREDEKTGVFYVDHKPVAREKYDSTGLPLKAKGQKIKGIVYELLPANHSLTIAKYKYSNSVRDGEGKKYSEDGKKVIETVTYKEGKLDGPRSVWNDKKVLLYEEEYVEGVLVKRKEFAVDGKVKKEMIFEGPVRKTELTPEKEPEKKKEKGR